MHLCAQRSVEVMQINTTHNQSNKDENSIMNYTQPTNSFLTYGPYCTAKDTFYSQSKRQIPHNPSSKSTHPETCQRLKRANIWLMHVPIFA